MSHLSLPQLFALIVFAVNLSACVSPNLSTKSKTEPEQTLCPEQRPQICTMDYRPVCATRDTGIRCITAPCPSAEQKTYSNACTACADVKVIGYIPNECPASSINQHQQ